jgi:hypothetical protein
MKLGLTLSIPKFRNNSVVYFEKTQDVLDYASDQEYTLPSPEKLAKYDNLLTAYYNEGLGDTSDFFHICAVDNDASDFARINTITPGTYNLIDVGVGPIFTNNQGFAGQIGGGLSTQYTPSANSVHAVLNDNCLFAWNYETPVNDGGTRIIMGSRRSSDNAATFIRTIDNNGRQHTFNMGTSVFVAPIVGGLISSVRTDVNVETQYKNGNLAVSGTGTSIGLSNRPYYVCGYNTGSISNVNNQHASFIGVMASNVAKQTALYTMLNTYMTSI